MKARLHAIVKGNVQGVFFRANTQRKASSLNLTGWVRNRSDGTVEVVAEGEKENLERLLQWLHEGPPAATVYSVNHEWHDYKAEFSSFTIKYGWD